MCLSFPFILGSRMMTGLVDYSSVAWKSQSLSLNTDSFKLRLHVNFGLVECCGPCELPLLPLLDGG